jgi:hypothetical protein
LSEIQDLYDVDVMELLGRARLFLELLLYLRVDVCDRDELEGNWFARAAISGLVSNRCAGSPEFSRCSIVVGGDAVVPKESCVFHIVPFPVQRCHNDQTPTILFNLNFGAELLMPMSPVPPNRDQP